MPVEQKYFLEVKIKIPADLIDLVSDYIIENLATGLVLEEEEGSDETGIIFYLPKDKEDLVESFNNYLASLSKEQSKKTVEIIIMEVKEAHWVEKYREGIKPVWIDDEVIIRPPWSTATNAPFEIIIEPKMAFGTGGHGTTRGCLLAVSNRLQPDSRFLDLGCGSGILSILASLKSAAFIKAIDYDRIAIDNCHENFLLNNVTIPNEILLGSIELCDDDDSYDFVCANIIRDTILEMFDRLITLTKVGGVLILSGLLAKDETAITDALNSAGQTKFSIHRDEDWLTYTVDKL